MSDIYETFQVKTNHSIELNAIFTFCHKNTFEISHSSTFDSIYKELLFIITTKELTGLTKIFVQTLVILNFQTFQSIGLYKYAS